MSSGQGRRVLESAGPSGLGFKVWGFGYIARVSKWSALFGVLFFQETTSEALEERSWAVVTTRGDRPWHDQGLFGVLLRVPEGYFRGSTRIASKGSTGESLRGLCIRVL